MVSIKATLFTILAVVAIVNAATLETGENKKFKGKKWALLVAGANYWYNYGIQADVCHAYQVLNKNGIPDENIVVMMYDDLAKHSKNPKPGTLINKPKGPDVYKNVPKDYTGSDVTAENFVNILTGNKEAMNGVGSGKVIESGPDDHVFIYYIDHGGSGLICFPSSELYANDLINALKKMHSEKKYGKLVFFLEACYSGSMFVNLPNNLNIFAVASSKKDESSWFFYHDETYDTFLGTLYGVAWMEDADKANTQKQSLLSEYNTVKKSVQTCMNVTPCEQWSHVVKFGDQKMGSMKMADFIGSHKKHTLDSIDMKAIPQQQQAVAAYDGPMFLLQKKLERTTNSLERLEIEVKLERIYEIRRAIDSSFETIVNYIAKEHSVSKSELLNSDRNLSTEEDYTCYKALLKSYFKNCFDIHKVHYVVTHFQKLVNYCTLPSAANGVPNLVKTIENTCSNFDFGVIDEAM